MVGLPLLAFVVSLQEPDTSVRVTFRASAAPMVRVLQALSEATKVPLAAAPTVRPDVILIDAKDVTLKDLMDRIALADSAEWRYENGTYRLSAAMAKRNAEARLETQHRAEAFRAQVEKRLHPKTPPKLPKQGEMPDLDNLPETPDQTAIFQILAQVSPIDIGSMGSDDRIVFATSPTQMQRPLGPSANGIVQTWVQKHNAAVAGIKGDPSDQAAPIFGGETPQMIKDMIANQTRAINAPIAKTMLVVEKNSILFGGTTVELRIYDAAGNVLKRAQSMLGMGQLAAMVNAIQNKKAPETSNTNTPIELSEDSKLLDKGLATLITGAMSLDFGPEIKPKLLRPDLYDPLSYHATDTLFSYAKWKKKPLVAIVPDTMATSIVGGGGFKSLEEFEKSFSGEGYVTALPDDKWIVLTPQLPVVTRTLRVDRVSLARLVRAGDSPSGVRLDDLAAYAFNNPPPMENAAATPYITAFAPGAMSATMMGGSSWSMLRFYGSLGEGEKQAFRNGRAVPFANLSSTQLRLISRMAYAPNARLSVDKPGEAAKKDDDTFAFLTTMMLGSKDYREEPTEILPAGVPPSGGVSVEVTDDNFIRPNKATGGAMAYSLGADELAMFQMFRESPGFSSVTSAMKLPTEGKLGQRTVLKFTFHFSPTVTLRQTLNDDFLPADAQNVQLDSLPDALKRRVAQRLESLKKGPLGMAGAILGAKPKANP